MVVSAVFAPVSLGAGSVACGLHEARRAPLHWNCGRLSEGWIGWPIGSCKRICSVDGGCVSGDAGERRRGDDLGKRWKWLA